MAQKPTTLATQEFVEVTEIRSGALVLRDGSLKKVIAVSGINFELKSEIEQNAITGAFQGLLNSLDFSIQFLIHSRRLNIEPYLATLKELERAETNELLKTQITEYGEFIKGLVSLANIMRKSFYVVISYVGAKTAVKGAASSLRSLVSGKKGKAQVTIDEDEFRKGSAQLQQRVDHLSAELSRMGLRSLPLGDDELKELLFNFYNPEQVEKILAHE